jgi:hypothetical protein
MIDNGLKYAGKAIPGQNLTGNVDYYTVRTLVNITPAAFGATTQLAFDALMRTVSLRGQPVVLGDVETALYAAGDTDLPAASTGNTVYVVKFIVEHKASWSTATPGLAKSLDGQNGFVYKLAPDVTTGNNVSVTINDSLV